MKLLSWLDTALAMLNILMAGVGMGFAGFIIEHFRNDRLAALQDLWRRVPLGSDGLGTDLGLPYRDFGAIMWAIIAMLLLASTLNLLVLFQFAAARNPGGAEKQNIRGFGPRLLQATLHVMWFVAVGGCATTAGLSYIMTLAIWKAQQDQPDKAEWNDWWEMFTAIFSMSIINMVVLVASGYVIKRNRTPGGSYNNGGSD